MTSSQQQISPSPAQSNNKFYYSPLLYYEEIRLLEVTSPVLMQSQPVCKLHTVPIHKAPRYNALSYCWGPNQCQGSILLNGKEFSVTENLLEALQTLQKEPGLYWVDAICINQADLQERGLQVSRMKTIFSTAEQVIVWLSGNVEPAFFYPTTAESTQLDGGRSSFFGNAYWRRVWVVQEFAVSTSVIILYQNGRITCNELLGFMSSPSVVGRNSFTVSQDWQGVECITRLISLSQSFIRCSPIYLLDLLWRSRSLLATDKLDKVYGLLGLAYDGDRFVRYPQYGISPRTLYKRMATSLLEKTGNLNILLLQHHLRDGYVPSWVLQWLDLQDIRSRDWIDYMIRRSTSTEVDYPICGLPRVEDDVLSVRGKMLDILASVTTPCYPGGPLGAPLDASTTYESRPTPYGCDDNIYFAIAKSLCFGLKLSGSSQTQHIIDKRMNISKSLRARLGYWLADNEGFRVGGKGLPFWTRETWGDMLRTNLYWLQHSSLATGLLNRSLGLSNEEVARLTAANYDDLRFYKEVDDSLYTFSTAQMRLSITEQGLVGVVTREASRGDKFVRLEGCERLIVLRKAQRSDRWVVVGEGWLCTDHTRLREVESEFCWFDIV